MSLDTVCFSINSDISSRIRESTLSNRSLARHFTSSVLPTPVGPTKIKETGFFLGLIPTRLRRIALLTASTASSWPTIWLRSLSERPFSCSYSWALILLAGILVQSSMMRAKFSIVTAGAGTFSSASISVAILQRRLRIVAKRS